MGDEEQMRTLRPHKYISRGVVQSYAPPFIPTIHSGVPSPSAFVGVPFLGTQRAPTLSVARMVSLTKIQVRLVYENVAAFEAGSVADLRRRGRWDGFCGVGAVSRNAGTAGHL